MKQHNRLHQLRILSLVILSLSLSSCSNKDNTSTQYNSDNIQSVSLNDLNIPSENATNEEIDQFLKTVEQAGAEVDDPDDERITYIPKEQIPKEHFGVVHLGDIEFTTPLNYTVREYSDDTSHYQSVVYNDYFIYVSYATTSVNEIEKWDYTTESAFDELCNILEVNAFPDITLTSYMNTTIDGDFTAYSSTAKGYIEIESQPDLGICDIEFYHTAPLKNNYVYTMVIVEPRDDTHIFPDKDVFISGFKKINNLR